MVSFSQAHMRRVVERLPYPTLTDLGSSLRIFHIYFNFLLYLQELPEATNEFLHQFSIKIFRKSPQFDSVAIVNDD